MTTQPFAPPAPPPSPSAFSSCIVCGGAEVEEFLDLGETALANKFLTRDELSLPEPKYPLVVAFCRVCGHVQLTRPVPPSAMFEDYLYVSSASQTLVDHFEDLSATVVQRYRPGGGELVVDIGCNDGALLQAFRRRGVRTLGVDPAANLAELARGSGVERYVGFFDSRSARTIAERWGRAAVITATNTFPHIPDLPDFVDGIRHVLAPDGVFVIEAHYLLDVLHQVAFDTIYHEHVSYWALGPMRRLFENNGMRIVDAERIPLHHGQLRVFVQHQDRGEVRPSVERLLQAEWEEGLDRLDTYRRFADETFRIKRELHQAVSELRSRGSRVVGYGAPAKGNTLLSFLEIGPGMIDYIVDRSPLKQGRFTPGLHIPVVDPGRLLTDQPEYVLLLAWNFMDEVLEQQAEYRRRGGKFILPVPRLQVV